MFGFVIKIYGGAIIPSCAENPFMRSLKNALLKPKLLHKDKVEDRVVRLGEQKKAFSVRGARNREKRRLLAPILFKSVLM